MTLLVSYTCAVTTIVYVCGGACCCIMINSQYCCSTPGPVNPAGDTLRSIADSLGLSDVLRYLESLDADLKGESVLFG